MVHCREQAIAVESGDPRNASGNRLKRLVNTPKLQFLDSGLPGTLLVSPTGEFVWEFPVGVR